jgi:hypothetical protein
MTVHDSYFVVQAFSLHLQPERLHHKHATHLGSGTDNSIVIATFATDDAPYVL